MPTIIINKTVFENLVGKKLSVDTLKDKLPMLGTSVEAIEGEEITVEICPNRPDLLSEQGLARAFSSFIGKTTGLREYSTKKSGDKVIIDKSVSNVRPYTACAIVKGINYDHEKIKEIVQLQEKLHITFGRNRKKAAIGIYPYEKIKPPIRFIAKAPKDIKFQPLESKREMDGLQILSQHPAGREYGELLEGLKKFPIFIDSEDNILSMPPIINSHATGKITEDTTDVFIECSGFDFRVLKICLNMIVTALADMGGTIYSMELEYPDRKFITPELKPKQMKVDLPYVNKRLGLEIKDKDIKKLLEQMGFGYKAGKALIPAYRDDIMHQCDLVEDICIAYGYENLVPEIPAVATIGKENPFSVFKDKIANILVGLGLIETKTYHLTSTENQKTKMNCDIKIIELANSATKEYQVLRSWVLPSLMEVLQNNKHRELPHKIYGIGTVFKKGNTDTGVLEQDRLAAALADSKADFTAIKQVLDYLMRMLNVEYKVEDCEHSSFIAGRVGRVSVKSNNVAYIGEVHPKVLGNWELDVPVSGLELNLSELLEVIN